MSSEPVTINAATIGEAWIAIAQLIMEFGVREPYDGLAMREVLMATLVVDDPTDDRRHRRALRRPRTSGMDARELRRLRECPELGDADSYATRLHNYAGTGLDQVALGERATT